MVMNDVIIINKTQFLASNLGPKKGDDRKIIIIVKFKQ